MPADRRGAIEVTVVLDAGEHVAGTLWIHEQRGHSAVFRYADSYIAHPRSYDLDPALPRSSGQTFSTASDRPVFNAFADGAPDRWGQQLMRRGERDRAARADSTARTLTPADFLLGTDDYLRQGAIRFRSPGQGSYFSIGPSAVPKLVFLPRLLAQAEWVITGETSDADISDLINAGGSLGGARPKAAVINARGALAIAKFPKPDSDEWDWSAWEQLATDLAGRCGIAVPSTEVLSVSGSTIFVTERFDREGAHRIGFASALTMLEATDHEVRSFVEIADVVERHSSQATKSLSELYRRMVFTVLISNTDNHLRNHGFLRRGAGWELSPAYDLNPNPYTTGTLQTGIDVDDLRSDIETALSVAPYFRLNQAEAREVIGHIESVTAKWAVAAKSMGIPRSDIDLMQAAFETEQRRAARRLAGQVSVIGSRSSLNRSPPAPAQPRST